MDSNGAVINNQKKKVTFASVMKAIGHGLKKFFTNGTFRYIVRRILTSFITLMILVALVAVLIRILPEEKFYDLETYRKLLGRAGGAVIAENYKNKQLFLYGLRDINGNHVTVWQNIGTYIYYILPIHKRIPYVWNLRYTEALQYWDGFIYLGRSVKHKEFVSTIVKNQMGISIEISVISTVLAYIVSFPLGVAMAKKPGGFWDKVGTVFIVLNYAIPALVFYLFIKNWFGDPYGIFGWAHFGYLYDPNNHFQSLFTPVFAIFFLSIPGLVIWIRRFMVDELNSDYVRFARAKGLSESRIMWTHVLRNASVPLIRNIPSTLLGSIIGSYFVETIWSIPGTGRELMNSLQGTPDIPEIQGLTVLYASISMLAFLLGDVITALYDPRIRLTSN